MIDLPVAAIVVATWSALFAYLTTRIAAAIWGLPALPARLAGLLEMGGSGPATGASSLGRANAWVAIAILAILETALAKRLLESLTVGDLAGAAVLALHPPLAGVWLAFLRSRYRATPGNP